jgi:hypothetical protein
MRQARRRRPSVAKPKPSGGIDAVLAFARQHADCHSRAYLATLADYIRQHYPADADRALPVLRELYAAKGRREKA